MLTDAIEYSAPSLCNVTSALPSSTAYASLPKEISDCSDSSSSLIMTDKEVTIYGSIFSASVIITENASVPSDSLSSWIRNLRYCTFSPGANVIVCSAEYGIASICSGMICASMASVRLPLTPLEPSSLVGSPVASSLSMARRLLPVLTASLPATERTESDLSLSSISPVSSGSSVSSASSSFFKSASSVCSASSAAVFLVRASSSCSSLPLSCLSSAASEAS